MKIRKNYGDKNLIGKKIYELRIAKGLKQKDLIAQIQAQGVDINPSSMSKLEGQYRGATDKEIRAIAKIFSVSYEFLLDGNENV